jgi:hypothetical protein
MQAYDTALKSGATRLLLSPDSQFFQYFNDAAGTQSDGASTVHAVPPAEPKASPEATPQSAEPRAEFAPEGQSSAGASPSGEHGSQAQ